MPFRLCRVWQLIVGAIFWGCVAPWGAHAIQTNEVEIGYQSSYDGSVKIGRDGSGNMIFQDKQVTSPMSLLDMSRATTATQALSALTDVALSSQSIGQGLGWNGSKWTNTTFSGTGLTTVTRVASAAEADVCTTATVAVGYGELAGGNAWTGTNDFVTTPTINGNYLGAGAKGDTGATGPQGPAGCPLPSYTGNAGKVLTVDTGETTATWQTASGGDALPPLAGNNNLFLRVNGSATGVGWSTLSGGVYSLESMSNVHITTPTTGQVLSYNSSVAGWVNATVSGGGGSASIYHTSGTLANGASMTVAHAADAGPGFKRHAQAFSQGSATALLLHANGTNGGTVFTDEMRHTITNSAAAISATASMFGGSSAYFNGSAYLTAPTGDDFRFPGDFTIDFWANFTSSSGSQTVYDGRVSNSDALTIYQSNGVLYLYCGGNVISGGTIAATTWYHIAVVRSGTAVKMYLNGSQVGNTWTSSALFASGGVFIGQNYGTLDYKMTGYVDEFRIVKGKALWTSNFTPPTAQYPAPDFWWSPVVPKITTVTNSYGYVSSVTYSNVAIKYSDASGDAPTTCTTFTNNTGGAINCLATVQILP